MQSHKRQQYPKSSVEFWIYRNYVHFARRSQRIVVHFGNCRCCKHGLGVEGNTPRVSPEEAIATSPKRAWIGPFHSIAAANAWIFEEYPYTVGRIPERCSVCCRPPDFWPLR